MQDKTLTLKETLRSSRSAFIVVSIVSAVLNLLQLTTPLYMLQVYDRVLASGSRDTLLYLTIIAVGAIAALGILESSRNSILNRIGNWVGERLGPETLRASLRASISQPTQRTHALRELSTLRNFVGSPSVAPFFDAPWAPIFILFIWGLHTWLGILALITAIILLAISLTNEMTTRRTLKEAATSNQAAMRDADRIIEHAETVHALNMRAPLEQALEKKDKDARRLSQISADRGGMFTGLSRFVRLSAQIGVLGIGCLLVLIGELSAGSMIAGSILLGRALAPIEQSIGAWRGFISARMSYGRINKLLDEFPADSQKTELPEVKGQLRVEGLFVNAPGSHDLILHGIDFAMNPGEAVAVIGPTAAGKSTLCRAIFGLMPIFRGAIRLDGAEIQHWSPDQFGQAVGYLPQTVELFEGTVAQNIAKMSDAESQAIIEATQLAGVHEVILSLPEGYDTRIGEGGIILSGGQKQSIGLARALFNNPKLIVLDEPNSNLDQAGEHALTQALIRVKQSGTTILIVAHRQSVIAAVDKILVLSNGIVEMFDDKDEVIKVIAERRKVSQTAQGLPS